MLQNFPVTGSVVYLISKREGCAVDIAIIGVVEPENAAQSDRNWYDLKI